MSGLVQFVNQHRTKKQDKDYNFQCLRGGKFLFQDKNQFVDIYAQNIHDDPPLSLGFRAPRCVRAPFFLDIDLRSLHEINVPDVTLVEVAHELLTHLKTILPENTDVWRVILTRRKESYWKEKLQRFCGGFHVYIPNLYLELETLRTFRQNCLADTYWVNLFKPFHVTNPPDDILDSSVCSRSNGMLLVGMNKPHANGNGKHSPHFILFLGTWRNAWFQESSAEDGGGWDFTPRVASGK